MVTLLGANPCKAEEEATRTRGSHARYNFLEKLYNEHVNRALDIVSDDV